MRLTFGKILCTVALAAMTFSCTDKQDNPINPQPPEESTQQELTEDFEDFASWITDAVKRCHPYINTFWGAEADPANFNLLLTDEDLDKLTKKVTTLAEELACQAGVIPEVQEQDVFPATHNNPALYPLAEEAAERAGLTTEIPPEPFRWSEDFGHYRKRCPAFFCGIGGGKDAAGLHTPDYQWNDKVTEAALRFFTALIKIGSRMANTNHSK